MRRQLTERVIVPEHEETHVSWEASCDSCGKPLERWGEEDNELVVSVNPEQCVSFAHRRDYCNECADRIWAGICTLIGADPDSEEKTGWDD